MTLISSSAIADTPEVDVVSHHPAASLEDTITTMYKARTIWTSPWSNFDGIIYHPIGIGGKQGETTTGNNAPIWIDYPN